jgi:signal transduction histidine kinase/ligand-binding sensor domain-containing protein
MALDRSGKIWLGLERGGVLAYDTLKKEFVKYFSPDKAPFFYRINKIFEDKNGSIWILTKGNGLAVYNPISDSFVHLTKDPISESSLGGNNCTSIIQDNTGILWIGATGDLNKYDPSKIKFQHIYNNPYKTFSLNDNMVRGVYEDDAEKLWIGTDGGVIHIIDRKKSSIEKIPIHIKGITQHVVAMNFLELDKNTMLVGSSIGLLQFDRTTKIISFYKPFENKIINRQVRQLQKDKDHLYFIHSGSLFIYNFNTKQTQVFTTFYNDVVNATSIYLDSKGRLWVGAKDGLLLFDSAQSTFKFYEFERKTNRPVGTYFMILSIFEHQGKLWVGTFNSGLWTLDLKNLENPEIKDISQNKGLPDNTVYATLPDQDGNLWMSTNRGISKFDLKNNLFLNFGLSDGLQHEEFNRLAAVKCKNGELVFGGINGLNIFNPKNIATPNEIYQPIILGVTVNHSGSNKEEFKGLLEQKEIELNNNENNLEFQFFIPNYRSPKRFEVYHQLVGYDLNWIKTEKNVLRYVNLLPGTYELKLKTVSVNGAENETRFLVNIQYPIWQTWWFILSVISVLIIIIYAIIKLNIKKAKEDKVQLEKLLRLRTQEIEKSREDLASLNQKKDVIFSILSHDLRSPLTTLKGFLSILIDNSEMLSKEDIKRHASNIRNSVTSSLDLIDNTLFWSLSQTGNITYTPTRFSLKSMFLRVSNLYLLTAEKKQIKLTTECDENVMLFADENMVYVALRNLVSNALKFTPEGKSVHISVIKNHSTAEIIVKDQGVGMSNAYIEKLLTEEHLQLKMGTSNEKGTGLGIILCKKFIHANNGTLEVKSIEGKGSEFIIRLPLAQD